MDHFITFFEIYCDYSYKLKEEVFLEQQYYSKSEISYFNYIIKKKNYRENIY